MKKLSVDILYHPVPKKNPPRYDLHKLKIKEDADTEDLNIEDGDLDIEK
jgi:hypothetical protein